MAGHDIFKAADALYGGGIELEERVLRKEPHAAAYMDTFMNRHSGDVDVVAHELDESLATQAEALQRKDPALFRRVGAFLAVQNTTQEFLDTEVA